MDKDKKMPSEFDNSILQISDNIRRTLQFISDDIKHKCEEIRLRAGKPVCLTVDGKVLFVCANSTVCNMLPKNPLISESAEVQKTLAALCKNSIYLHENEIKQGFISLPNGCRAGVCGMFNADGMLISVSSINIRIARQIFGCANELLPYANGGLLIAGPPGSGKTTMLRDLVRQLSNGENGKYSRVTVIDSRSEISGGGVLDLGVNTDILYTLDKSVGIDIALRTMYPNYIAFDEIGNVKELNGVTHCFNAGVGIITTAHCRDRSDLLRRQVVRQIIKSGAVSNVALLPDVFNKCIQILTPQEIKRQCF